MDINSQGKLDYNLFQLNPQWQHMITNGAPPDPTKLCPCNSDNPADWTNSASCTSQPVYMNTGKTCPNLGGHVNWFPVTYEGSLFWSDKSNAGSDDDYNFDMRRNDGALYTGTNEHIRLEFDSDETVDHWDNTGTFFERFHHEVDNDDRNGSLIVKGQFAIVIGLVGLDGGHENCESEIHPVYAMFIHTKDDPSDDRWSFFIRNWGNEGWCSSGQENLYRTYLQVVLPHKDFDDVSLTSNNCWANNFNSNMGISSMKVPEGFLLSFNFDEPEKKGCFFGDLTLKWTGPQVKPRNDFNQNPIGGGPANGNAHEEMTERERGDEELQSKINQLSFEARKELISLLNGATTSERYPLLPKPTLTQVTQISKPRIKVDSIQRQMTIIQRTKKLPDYSKIVRTTPDQATVQRKQLRRELIRRFLKDKGVL
jgi:hypothetical protein